MSEETEETQEPKSLAEYVNEVAAKHGLNTKPTEQFTLPSGDIEWRSGAEGDPKRGVLHREGGPAVIKANGDQQWWTYNLLHRENGPAIERADGYKAYFNMGRLSREEGPAIETAKGSTAYYKGGKPHRDENQPAIELASGRKYYFVEGQAHRLDGPVFQEGSREVWKREGELHRDGGPAFVNGTHAEYRTFGVLHRYEGPAYDKDGNQKYYLHGVEVYPSDFREMTQEPEHLSVSRLMRKHPDVLLHAAKLFFIRGDETRAKTFKALYDLVTRSARDAGRF